MQSWVINFNLSAEWVNYIMHQYLYICMYDVFLLWFHISLYFCNPHTKENLIGVKFLVHKLFLPKFSIEFWNLILQETNSNALNIVLMCFNLMCIIIF